MPETTTVGNHHRRKPPLSLECFRHVSLSLFLSLSLSHIDIHKWQIKWIRWRWTSLYDENRHLHHNPKSMEALDIVRTLSLMKMKMETTLKTTRLCWRPSGSAPLLYKPFLILCLWREYVKWWETNSLPLLPLQTLASISVPPSPLQTLAPIPYRSWRCRHRWRRKKRDKHHISKCL